MINQIANGIDKLYSIVFSNPEKETIILLHGGPGVPADFNKIIEVLKDNFQIIVFHQRGTKKSPCLSRDYSMNAYIEDINCVAEFYGISKFHLFGHSWGGLLTQIYSEKHPENILSLFLCSPGSGTNFQWKETEKEVMQFNKSECTNLQWIKMGINNLLGIFGSDDAYKRLFRQVMNNYNIKFTRTESNAAEFDNVKAEPVNKTRSEIIKYPVLKRQENLNCKITIVYGNKDIYQSSKNFVIERYPSNLLYTIENCGHIPWLHNPIEYNRIMENHYK